VEIGKPGIPENFNVEEINGIQLYVEKSIRIHPNGGEITFLKGLFRKGLRVFGVISD